MSDATALAAAIADGRTSARAAMEASLSACSTHAGLGAVVYIDEGMAREKAKAADILQMDHRGPFHGVPFLAKDLGATASGLPAAAGLAAIRNRKDKPKADNHLFDAFNKVGLNAFGLTATPPFGLSLNSAPEAMPEARNPWNSALTPGGSSGGAAAAVAAGIVSIAHATDAAGSIRVPAACCGLAGLKPSRGAIPGGPDFTNHLMGIASELVLARSVRDIRKMFETVQVALPPVAQPDTPQIALALPDRCDANQIKATRAAADALSDAGCTIIEIAAPDAYGTEAHKIAREILTVSLAEWIGALELSDGQLPALVAATAAEGRAIPATQLFATSRQMASLTDRAQTLFANADAILTPVLSSPPPPVGSSEMTQTDTDAHFARMESFAPNAALANVAGLCAFALPFGMQSNLPVGVQLLGAPGADQNICRFATMIEERAPDLCFPNAIAGMPT